MKFEVDTGALAAAHSSMQTALERVTKGKTQMYQALETLEGMWSGSAHDAFQAQYRSDDEQMTRLCQEVQRILDLVEEARGAYESCDQEVQAWIGQLQV